MALKDFYDHPMTSRQADIDRIVEERYREHLERNIAYYQAQMNNLQGQLYSAHMHAQAMAQQAEEARVKALDIRDQIAMECLKVMLAWYGAGSEAAIKFTPDGLAKSAYEMADAMMKERTRSMPQPIPVQPNMAAIGQGISQADIAKMFAAYNQSQKKAQP